MSTVGFVPLTVAIQVGGAPGREGMLIDGPEGCAHGALEISGCLQCELCCKVLKHAPKCLERLIASWGLVPTMHRSCKVSIVQLVRPKCLF